MIFAQRQSLQKWLVDITSILILFGIFYALWLGSHPLFIPDEGRYSEVAREMVASGDYITPRLNGVAFLDKPALYYWLQASAIHVFGLNEWALRFWPAAMGIIASTLTYITGTIIFNRRTGIIAAIILATSPLFYGAAHYANLDLEVAALIADALLCFIASTQLDPSRAKKGFLLAAYAFAGLAALTKGLIGLVFPVLIIGAWIIILNRWRMLTQMRLFTGILIFFMITLPWYYLVQKANPEFLHFFFVTQQVSRFLTTQDFNDKAALWFYIPVVLMGFFPWSLFLFQALGQKIKNIWQNRQAHAVDLFLVLWFLIVFAFFSIPKSKTVGYILPLFPPCALIVASYLNHFWENAKAKSVVWGVRFYILTAAICGLSFIAAPSLRAYIFVPEHAAPYLIGMGLSLFVSSVIVYILANKATIKTLFMTLAATISIVLLIFIASASAMNEKSIKPLVMQLKANLQPSDEVISYYKYYQDLPIYLQRRITIVADWHAADIPHNDNWLREMWYGMVFQDTKDWLIEEPAFWSRWKSDKRLYVITDESNYKKLNKQTKVYKLSQLRTTYVLTNKPIS